MRRTALILTGSRPADADGDRVAALAAIRRVFDTGGVNALGSEPIVEALNSDDELPFGDWRKGAGIDARGLPRLLRPFGIAPRNVRAGGVQCKGYHRERFVDAWERYCEPPEGLRETPPDAFSPQEDCPDPSHRPDPNHHGGVGHVDDPSPDPQWDGRESAEIAGEHGELDAGTDQDGQPGTETRIDVLSAPSANGRADLAKLTHEQRLEHWQARREQHQRELKTGVPTLAELNPEELLAMFPGAELERTDVDRAAEVLACSLAGAKHVLGQWWPSAPIRRGSRCTGSPTRP